MTGRIIACVALALSLTATGCAPLPTSTESTESQQEQGSPSGDEQPQIESAAPIEEMDFGYLAATWTIDAELTTIDRGAMREQADRPSHQWECTLQGDTMTIITDAHTYVGTIEPQLDDGWAFSGTAELTDEDGAEWVNTLTVSGLRTGDDTIAGTMTLAVDSAVLGHSYTAEWDFEGHRQ